MYLTSIALGISVLFSFFDLAFVKLLQPFHFDNHLFGGYAGQLDTSVLKLYSFPERQIRHKAFHPAIFIPDIHFPIELDIAKFWYYFQSMNNVAAVHYAL